MDEYSRRCDPQGARGSGGVATRSGSRGGGPGGVGTNGGANGDGSIRGGGGTVTGTDVDGIGMIAVNPPAEGVGAGMKMGDGDLFLIILFRLWRSVRSPSRNFWSFRTW